MASIFNLGVITLEYIKILGEPKSRKYIPKLLKSLHMEI